MAARDEAYRFLETQLGLGTAGEEVHGGRRREQASGHVAVGLAEVMARADAEVTVRAALAR